MAGQDPIHNAVNVASGLTNAKSILDALHSKLVDTTIGWVEDEYTAAAPFGAEMYLHTGSGFGSEAYFSMKACDDPDTDQSVLLFYANTGYDATKRVDNQPGMWLRHNSVPSNAAAVATVFGGGATNGSGDYQTGDNTNPLNFNTSAIYGPQSWKTSTLDQLWIISDLNATPGKRTITLIWYLDKQIQMLSFGKVYYDLESGKTDGNFAMCLSDQYANRAGGNVPGSTGVLSGKFQTGKSPVFGIIRPRTHGAVQWPAGTATGAVLLNCGLAVINEGKIESANEVDGTNGEAALPRPDMGFTQLTNVGQTAGQPKPRLAIHYDTGNGRRMLARQRQVSRFPDGGKITTTSSDWKDSGYFFPWNIAPTYLLDPGAIISNGTRRYICFPSTRFGTSADNNRHVGYAFRIADA